MPIPFPFDYRKPDYIPVFEHRIEKLRAIRAKPQNLPALKQYYRENIAQFIIDWGCTSDPRHVSEGLPTVLPFLLFPKQEEWVAWFMERWKNKDFAICEKSREVGITWLAAAVSASVCLLNQGVIVGFGSRKAEYVDNLMPKCIFHKIRQFIKFLPPEFKGKWDENNKTCSKIMNIMFPETGSTISGEAGDGIGRGDRASFYFVDESAFLERPQLVDMGLSATTNCRIDISTPHGASNPFAIKRFTYDSSLVFTLRWQDDPRKDQAWYEEQCRKLNDPVVIAQELDLDYNASVEGVVIPNAWVIAALDAHIKLGVEVKGIRKMGFDVADEGADKNAVCGRYGVMIEYVDEWSGINSDIYKSVDKVFGLCDLMEYPRFDYDADGLGAGVRGDASQINDKRPEEARIKVVAFRGSGAVVDPLEDPFRNASNTDRRSTGRTNEDYFANAKAQGWYALKKRFYNTYRAVVEKADFHPDDIISIPSTLPKRDKLIMELSQPQAKENTAGKVLIDKLAEGARSPNLADAVMIAFAPTKREPGGFFSAAKIT